MIDIKTLVKLIRKISSNPELWNKEQSECGERDAKRGLPPAHFDDPYYSAYEKECAKILKEY